MDQVSRIGAGRTRRPAQPRVDLHVSRRTTATRRRRPTHLAVSRDCLHARRAVCDALVTAASNNDRKTGAHAYLGMDLLVGGRIADAREHFLWLKEYGNKRFLEYTLAVAELARLGL